MPDLFAVDTNESLDTAADQSRPLADRLRPKTLEDVVGQDHLVGEGGTLMKMIKGGHLPSLIFWGPPGCGKTTLAKILAAHTDLHFEQLSAIFSGVADLRKVFEAAKIRKRNGQGTLLFVDEIHRFNKSQQDAFLPVMEDGRITLVGATTENPSFELNAALLSRAQVLGLKRLDEAALETLLHKAETLAVQDLPLTPEARALLITMADGDGRYALSMAEQMLSLGKHPREGGDLAPLDAEALLSLLQRRAPLYDKGNDAHFNLISAFHKSLRASDADAALYWMARMLTAGEDPHYILRRMACVASEDISNADPQALQTVMAAWQAFDRLGLPEGELAMAQACTYLATAPKSNASYKALKAAKAAAKETGSLMPPRHAMNAPSKMMKAQGYSDGYIYDHDTPEGFSGLSYFPDDLPREAFYQPVERGFEREIKKRLEYWAKRRKGT
ncbi:MAG: replication-associated recombination protein A [Alphaproteobacteria bacterium]|nr:replication-associated recombination protein A [Alphaproteobacteria bacterium]